MSSKFTLNVKRSYVLGILLSSSSTSDLNSFRIVIIILTAQFGFPDLLSEANDALGPTVF